MAWFGRRQSYDRTRLLRKAVRARKQGRRKKAIKLYRDVLAVEPNDTHVHQGFVDQAIGVLREAARHLADEPNVWHTLSRLELERHRPADAVSALLEGAGHFRFRRTRDTALSLLLAARKIDPAAFETNLALGRMLAYSGAYDRGKRLLAQLADRTHDAQQRAVRALLFRISPTPAAAWRWLLAVRGS